MALANLGSSDERMPVNRPRTALRCVRPGAGRAVLACRCGTVLDLADLCRPPRPTGPHAGFRIAPIGCRACMAGAR